MAINNLDQFGEKEFEDFKDRFSEFIEFAVSNEGLNFSVDTARNWALDRAGSFAGRTIEDFKELFENIYEFASSVSSQ